MSTDSLQYLQDQIIAYRDQRDWRQFHSAKNCAANIAVEAGELLDFYRWSDHSSDPKAAAEEAADILYAILLYAEAAGVDLGTELLRKLAKNATKYPVAKAKGKPHKYTDL